MSKVQKYTYWFFFSTDVLSQIGYSTRSFSFLSNKTISRTVAQSGCSYNCLKLFNWYRSIAWFVCPRDSSGAGRSSSSSKKKKIPLTFSVPAYGTVYKLDCVPVWWQLNAWCLLPSSLTLSWCLSVAVVVDRNRGQWLTRNCFPISQHCFLSSRVEMYHWHETNDEINFYWKFSANIAMQVFFILPKYHHARLSRKRWNSQKY